MSQIFKSGVSGPVPPSVPTSFVTDVNSPAVPALNILDVFGNDITTNNVNGIQTDGSSGSNILTIQLTNRLQGSVTTVGLVTTPIITFTPTVIGTYSIECRVAAYNTTSLLGSAYSIFFGARFDGVNSNLCGVADIIVNEEGAMSSAKTTVTVSGSNILINAIGYALQTINWSAVGLYTFVGA